MIRRASIRVTCLRCRHEGVISASALERFGLSDSAPISTFVKRLRCSKCGSGSEAN
jgi:ribosomal protein S27E